jgi:hypothetical protein
MGENFGPKKMIERLIAEKRMARNRQLEAEDREARKPKRRRVKRIRETPRRCQRGGWACNHSTIGRYVREGRSRDLRAGRLLPRADKVPIARCSYCMVDHLVARYGEEVRSSLLGHSINTPSP